MQPGIEAREDGMHVRGDLVFATVPRLLETSRHLFAGGRSPLKLDLAEIRHVDSAGLALLVEWSRQAGAAGLEVHFCNVTDQLRVLAEASGLEKFLLSE